MQYDGKAMQSSQRLEQFLIHVPLEVHKEHPLGQRMQDDVF